MRDRVAVELLAVRERLDLRARNRIAVCAQSLQQDIVVSVFLLPLRLQRYVDRRP